MPIENQLNRSSPKPIPVVLSLLAFPILVWFAIQATTNTQDLGNWIDRSSVEFARYQTFLDRFGTDDDVVVSWPECTADSPKLLELVSQLRAESDGRFHRVVAGAEALNRLRESASQFSDISARRRLRGSLFGDDLKTTCAVVGLSEKGRDSLADSLDSIVAATKHVTGLERDQFHVVGKAVNSLELNRQTNQSLPLGIPGALLAALIACVAIGNTRMTIGILWTAGFAALLSLAAVTIVGIPVNGLLVLMPVLVFVLSLGGAIHMARAWQAVVGNDGVAVEIACSVEMQISVSLLASRPPIVVSFLTTSIGFATLCFSPLPAVFQFGLFSAGSLLVAMALLLLLLPKVWLFLNARATNNKMKNSDPLALRLLMSIAGYRWSILLTSLAVIVAGGFGLSRFQADLQVDRLFSNSTRVTIDNNWTKQNLFPNGRVEMVVSFPREKQLNRFQQLMFVRNVQTSLRKLDEHHSGLSVANFVAIPKTNGPLERNLVQQMIATQLDMDFEQLSRDGMLCDDDSSQHWRISVACKVTQSRDELATSQLFLDTANNALQENENQIQVEATGLGPVSAAGQRRLFSDLARGLIAAILVITPLLMIALRRIGLGLLAMLPNLFPLVVVFGYCGWTGKQLDIGAILTASVGLGIAIDDTLHFLHYERLKRAEDSADASLNSVGLALRHCWAPVTTTTAVICIGLSPFWFSLFLPIKNFAACLSMLMLVAVVADLVVLPALLGGVKQKNEPDQN